MQVQFPFHLHSFQKHVVVWFVAGVFVYMTIPITTAGIGLLQKL